MTKKRDHDAIPKTGKEVRECGPIDPNFQPETEVEQRMQKQKHPTSLKR